MLEHRTRISAIENVNYLLIGSDGPLNQSRARTHTITPTPTPTPTPNLPQTHKHHLCKRVTSFWRSGFIKKISVKKQES
ncbi:hypothetical protein L6452_05008 [Arctium lappa]|uniref:Uncharacterized protein n=1 Tax=Arctium lappa TaxID=4217 RepID=A0ACB9EFC5_ARCLA|nr:hypothetical protein L6452_05008 [Arctium lappa]